MKAFAIASSVVDESVHVVIYYPLVSKGDQSYITIITLIDLQDIT